MALSQVGAAVACTEVALSEVGAARALQPASPGYKKAWVATSPPPPAPRPRLRRHPSHWSNMVRNVADIQNVTFSEHEFQEGRLHWQGGLRIERLLPDLLSRAPLLAKRTFFVSEERLCRLKVRRICLGRGSHVRKGQFFVTEGNPQWLDGAPYLLRRASSWVKMVPFVIEGRLHLREALKRFWRAPHLLIRAPSWVEMTLFRASWELSLVGETQ